MKKIILSLFLLSFFSAMSAMAQQKVKGTVVSLGGNKIGIFGQPDQTLNNVLFRNINITFSIADQGPNNPTNEQIIKSSNIANLDLNPVDAVGGQNPHIFGGRAYYSFLMFDNFVTTTTTWLAGSKNNLIAEFTFPGVDYLPTLRLDDVSPNGGPNLQMYWYVEIIQAGNGDITDYDNMFYGTAAVPPVNNGATAPSYVPLQPFELVPVNFISFTAVKNGEDALLNWVVGNETDQTDHYEIQRSYNGNDFVTISTVTNTGNNNGSYSRHDAGITSLATNVVYYRIKQVDKDGEFVYSPVRPISLAKTNSIRVFPNPVKDFAKLDMELIENAQVNIILFDAAGKAVLVKKVAGIKGTNIESLNMQSFAKGKYNLRVTMGKETKDMQVIKGE
jgi:hypothetical protein